MPLAAKHHFACLLIGTAIGAVVIGGMLRKPSGNLDEVALAANTQSVFSQRDSLPIHIDRLGDLPQLAQSLSAQSRSTFALWLGNSQLHAINQRHDGEENVIARLHDLSANDDVFVGGASFPNANFQEHLAAFAALLAEGRRPDLLILPAVFDDTREDGIRAEICEYLTGSTAAGDHLSGCAAGRALLKSISTESHPTGTTAPPSASMQDHTEDYLESNLSVLSDAWKRRSELRGKVFVSLYRSRNWLFGITAQSVRRKIPARYTKNLDAFRGCLQLASDNSVRTIVYVAPLRNDVPIPYDRDEYAAFKTDVRRLCFEFSAVRFEDLESVVPNSLWGTKASTGGPDVVEYDFMHFQAAGHCVLADRVYKLVDEQIDRTRVAVK